MLLKQQITDSMWDIGKGIADKYNTKDIVIFETPGEGEVQLGYGFTYKRKNIAMFMTYDILQDGLLQVQENVWEIEVNSIPVKETFSNIGQVFDYLKNV